MKNMGVKQIIFTGPSAAAMPSSSSFLTAFDYVMIGILVVLIGLSIYYIVTAPKITENFAAKKKLNNKLIHAVPNSKKKQHFTNAPPNKKNNRTYAAHPPHGGGGVAHEGFKNSKPKYKVVYIYMNGCPYCVKFDKTYAEVSSDAKYQFEKIDVREASEYTSKYQCNGFPCYLVLDLATGELAAQGTGYRSPDEFRAWLRDSAQ